MTDSTTDPANIIGVPDGAMLQNLMGQINGNPGPRQVPGRTIPVPTSVSADLQTAIAMPYRNSEWLLNPPDAQSWKDAVADLRATTPRSCAVEVPPATHRGQARQTLFAPIAIGAHNVRRHGVAASGTPVGAQVKPAGRRPAIFLPGGLSTRLAPTTL